MFQRLPAFSTVLLLALPLVVTASCSCEDEETGTGGSGGSTSSTSGTTTSSGSTTSSVSSTATSSSGEGGTGGGGAGGGAITSPWVPGEPGTPGESQRLGNGLAFAQGLSRKHIATSAHHRALCPHLGEGGGGAGGGTTVSTSVGVGGSGGSGGSGGAAPSCTEYAEAGTLTTSTDLVIAVGSMPVFQPATETCEISKEPINFGAIYVGSCNNVTKVDLFTEADVGSFFGSNNDSPLPKNTEIMVNGGLVRLISGLAVKTALIGNDVIAVSNVSSKLIRARENSEVPGTYVRDEFIPPLETVGISAILGLEDGTLLIATHRTFTEESWYGVQDNDPATLVEADPIRIYHFDPATELLDLFATINGGSRVMSQASISASLAGAPHYFIAGSANVLTYAQDGGYLFSDRIDGTIYKIASDGSTVDPFIVLPNDTLISGLTEAPNGITYVTKSPTANFNCDEIQSLPSIAYWDAELGQLVDWQGLNDSSYADALLAIQTTGVLERSGPLDRTFLGSGLFVDLDHDLDGNLIVTASLTGVTEAYPVVVPDEGSGGAGGGGGGGGGNVTATATGSGGQGGVGGSTP